MFGKLYTHLFSKSFNYFSFFANNTAHFLKKKKLEFIPNCSNLHSDFYSIIYHVIKIQDQIKSLRLNVIGLSIETHQPVCYYSNRCK